MIVDLATLPAPLAGAVRAVRGHRRDLASEPFTRRQPDAAVRAWARDVVQSGDLAAAIAEVAAADAELRA